MEISCVNPLIFYPLPWYTQFICFLLGGWFVCSGSRKGDRERRGGYFIIRAHSHIFLTETHVKIKGRQLHWITTPSQVSTEEGVS